uniref:HDC05191 n=1 Tax=Drosophila melanogaster TaxID=7227 RepID=Q6IGU1_DROME|nr:TPA_inf: HDC05191 [Drosophila melanogaster]
MLPLLPLLLLLLLRPFPGQNLQHEALLILILILGLGLRLRHWHCMSCTLQLSRNSPGIPFPCFPAFHCPPPDPDPGPFPLPGISQSPPPVAHYGVGYVAGKSRCKIFDYECADRPNAPPTFLRTCIPPVQKPPVCSGFCVHQAESHTERKSGYL